MGCVTMPVAATKVNNKIGYVVVHMHMTYYTCCCRRVRMFDGWCTRCAYVHVM